MDMVFVPGGTFKMGSADPDVEAFYTYCEQVMGEGKCWFDWFADEQPYHAVTLNDFWMQRTEVTNAQYAAFLDELGNQHGNEAQWYDIDTLGAQIIEQASNRSFGDPKYAADVIGFRCVVPGS